MEAIAGERNSTEQSLPWRLDARMDFPTVDVNFNGKKAHSAEEPQKPKKTVTFGLT